MSFVKFGPANQESIGDIRRVSNCLFSVSSYISTSVKICLAVLNIRKPRPVLCERACCKEEYYHLVALYAMTFGLCHRSGVPRWTHEKLHCEKVAFVGEIKEGMSVYK